MYQKLTLDEQIQVIESFIDQKDWHKIDLNNDIDYQNYAQLLKDIPYNKEDIDKVFKQTSQFQTKDKAIITQYHETSYLTLYKNKQPHIIYLEEKQISHVHSDSITHDSYIHYIDDFDSILSYLHGSYVFTHQTNDKNRSIYEKNYKF